MPKTILKIGQSRVVQDDVGRYLEEKMARHAGTEATASIYTYPSNGLPKLDIKSPSRPKTA